MPASLCHIAVHIVFSTKNHNKWLSNPHKAAMHSYIKGVIDNIGGRVIEIGGIEDHIHILCLMPRDLSIGDFMAKIKANSSKWFRQNHFPNFHWQDGYAAFSVSKSNIETVRRYIMNQEEHHHGVSAVAEYEDLLAKHSTHGSA